MLKWEGCIKCITFGNIRTYLWDFSHVILASFYYTSDLATRKEMREQAWQLDGWADTVSKVRDQAVTYN